VVVFVTGFGAEDRLADFPGISRTLVDAHQSAAFAGLAATVALALVSLVSLIVSRRATPRWVIPSVLVLSLLAGLAMAWAANLGGQIRHPEMRSTYTSPPHVER
jgi:uncharacterized membrane protein